LKDAVIIFDEAHNIDSLCEQGSDMRLTTETLLQAIGELKLLIKLQSKRFLHRQFTEPH
jgi:Rad3-related DNA helicase